MLGPSPEAILQRVRELPLLPTVVMRMLALDPESPDFFDRVVGLAREDPPFAVEIISAVNNLDAAPLMPVLRLGDAVTRMGANHVLEMVTEVTVRESFVPNEPTHRHLWSHALEVAGLARALAGWTVFKDADSEAAYLCGLLHDIGRFVMFDDSPDEFGLVDGTHLDSPESLIHAEREAWGFDHVELGLLAAKQMGLPEILSTVIRLHHIPLSLLRRVGDIEFTLAALVQVSDVLALAISDLPVDAHPPEIVPVLGAVAESRDWPEELVEFEPLAMLIPGIRAEVERSMIDLGLATPG
ncbi:MAG: HDOD domain-containing protein [Actinomycetia bacterium]|nr:HDOD domain-containing protein [Actinomycetes bacterium]